MNPRHWALKGLKMLLFGAFFAAALGFVTMHLWNYLIPAVFQGPVISFWQALGLLVLARLLTGFRPGGGWGRPRDASAAPWAGSRKKWRARMQQRLASLSEEQRADCRARMAKCGPRWACGDDSVSNAAAPAAANPAGNPAANPAIE